MHQNKVGTPFQRLAMDIAGPYSDSERGNQYLPITIVYISKWLEVFAIPAKRYQKWRMP
jgi:hypothetical protein